MKKIFICILILFAMIITGCESNSSMMRTDNKLNKNEDPILYKLDKRFDSVIIQKALDKGYYIMALSEYKNNERTIVFSKNLKESENYVIFTKNK